jgi:hypothetical protein
LALWKVEGTGACLVVGLQIIGRYSTCKGFNGA